MFFHNCFQFVEPVVPHFAEGLNEIGYFFHFFRIEVIIDLPAVLLLFKQFTYGNNLQLLGDSWPLGVELDGEGRCFETVGLAVSKLAAMAPAVIAWEATSSRMALLVGSAIAWKTSLRKFIM